MMKKVSLNIAIKKYICRPFSLAGKYSFMILFKTLLNKFTLSIVNFG